MALCARVGRSVRQEDGRGCVKQLQYKCVSIILPKNQANQAGLPMGAGSVFFCSLNVYVSLHHPFCTNTCLAC